MSVAPHAANVNLRQLRAFAAIGRLASFTKAAAMLHTTQPALSAQIRELEDALGVKLFDRNTRAVALTRAGEELLPVVGQVLDDLGSVVDRAKDAAAGRAGRVTIAALPSLCTTLLPTMIAAFRAQHPGVRIALRDAIAGRVIDLVRAREVDVGVTSDHGIDANLDFLLLARDRIVAVLPPRHALARRRKLDPSDLLEYPLILMDRDTSVRHVVDAAFVSLGRIIVPAFEATYMSSAVGMVRAGLGLTLLPSYAMEVRTATDLVVRPIAGAALERRIGVVSMRGRSLSPAAQAFVDALAVHAKRWPR